MTDYERRSYLWVGGQGSFPWVVEEDCDTVIRNMVHVDSAEFFPGEGKAGSDPIKRNSHEKYSAMVGAGVLDAVSSGRQLNGEYMLPCERAVVQAMQDESIFNSNLGEKTCWAESQDKAPMRSKNQGQGLMASDFVTEEGGFVRFTPEEFGRFVALYPEKQAKWEAHLKAHGSSACWGDGEAAGHCAQSARYLFEYGKENGYFSSPHFLLHSHRCIHPSHLAALSLLSAMVTRAK